MSGRHRAHFFCIELCFCRWIQVARTSLLRNLQPAIGGAHKLVSNDAKIPLALFEPVGFSFYAFLGLLPNRAANMIRKKRMSNNIPNCNNPGCPSSSESNANDPENKVFPTAFKTVIALSKKLSPLIPLPSLAVIFFKNAF